MIFFFWAKKKKKSSILVYYLLGFPKISYVMQSRLKPGMLLVFPWVWQVIRHSIQLQTEMWSRKRQLVLRANISIVWQKKNIPLWSIPCEIPKKQDRCIEENYISSLVDSIIQTIYTQCTNMTTKPACYLGCNCLTSCLT